MKTLSVNTGSRYQLTLGSGLLACLGREVKSVVAGEKIAIISDKTVWALYGSAAKESLRSSGFSVVHFLLSPGENSKNGDNFLKILNFLAQNKLSRQDGILALGGGVVGDLAGFCAACYLRGIPYIQVPTTLLSAVDASVGGKTAIDLPAGKNLAGAFYQPAAVLCDTDCLVTLPEDIFRDGCAEVIKYAVLYDPALFVHLEAHGPQFDREYVIGRCVELKAAAVEADERDLGVRRLLNFGHTLGHSIEACSGYTVSHGRAVAIGMAVFTQAAAGIGLCSREDCRRILSLLEQFALPVSTAYKSETLLQFALSDKKRTADTISVILPRAIGTCQIHKITPAQLLELMRAGGVL